MNDGMGLRRMQEVISRITKRQAEDVVYWYARCRGVSRLGVFRTQLEAWESVMASDGTGPKPEATVWCEPIVQKPKGKIR